METSDFSWALRRVKTGSKIARKGWNGKGMYIIEVDTFVHGDDIIGKFLTIKGSNDRLLPWVPSQQDLYAEDWELVK